MLGIRTLVRLDAEKYSDLVRIIETATDAEITSALNRNIKKFSENALKNIGQNTGHIIRIEGDGSLIRFDRADEAHKFAVALHHLTVRENLARPEQSKIWFRIGCATGEIDLNTNDGYLNAIAFRLEPKAQPGGILIDSQMYNELSPEAQKQYDTKEIIEGKRDEIFYARRWLENSKSAQLKQTDGIDIINRILEIPQIPNSHTYCFEAITLDSKADVVRREPREIKYIIEPIENQELRMVIVPAGEYGMGSSGRKAPACEKPQHRVRVSAFLMSQYPITKAQWKIVATLPIVNRKLKKAPCKGTINSPVTNVSWHDAVEFCDRLSRQTGYTYTLPTESQWEYACRAGTSTDFHFGETISAQYANYDGTRSYRLESPGIYREKPSSISEFKSPNKFGFFDMHGNVWEWCLDHWHDNYESAPSDGQAWLEAGKSIRLVRGGSWVSEPHLCRTSHRFSNNDSDNLANDIGFRVVRLLN
jgi:formylglycine-generating enzyme required for sulfatase activity